MPSCSASCATFSVAAVVNMASRPCSSCSSASLRATRRQAAAGLDEDPHLLEGEAERLHLHDEAQPVDGLTVVEPEPALGAGRGQDQPESS